MASAVHTTNVLSAEFFSLFDQLEVDASSLESSTEALKQAKTNRDEAQTRLRNLQQQLRKTRATIKEQKDRIKLVSSHWFYGTTLFQPQLWLRGGCQGKITRARAKLDKAQDDALPRLLAEITTLQEVEVPRLQTSVDERLSSFDLSANAASERQVMRERVFAEYPSQSLLQFQQTEESLERRISNVAREIENLNDVMPKLLDGQQCYRKATKLLEESLKRNEKFQELQTQPVTTPSPAEALRCGDVKSRSETRVPDGTRIVTIDHHNGDKDIIQMDRRGNILSTNFPCPNQCGFLITKFGTHCCQACKHRSGNHGPRCQRKVVASHQCAQTKLNNLILREQAHRSNLTRENDACNKTFASARQESKQGERLVRQALSSIAVSIRERYSVVCSGLHARMAVPSSPGGSPCSEIRASNIRFEVTEVTNSQLTLTEQISSVEQLQRQIQQDGEDLQHELQSTRSVIESEQNRIFRELRERVLLGHDTSNLEPVPSHGGGGDGLSYSRPPAFAPHGTPTPSAPVEGEILGSLVNDVDNVPMATATLIVDD